MIYFTENTEIHPSKKGSKKMKWHAKPILVLYLVFIGVLFGTNGCTKKEEQSTTPSSASNKGIGPIQSISLGPIDPQKAAQGKQVFDSKCSACHKFEERYVGPPLKGVTQRRTPEWILNMILNPQEMTQKDPAAKELLATYLTQMTFQNVSEEEAKQILEYLRQYDQ